MIGVLQVCSLRAGSGEVEARVRPARQQESSSAESQSDVTGAADVAMSS